MTAAKYIKQKLVEIKRKADKSINISRDVNPHLSTFDRTTIQKIRRLEQHHPPTGVVDKNRTLHPK